MKGPTLSLRGAWRTASTTSCNVEHRRYANYTRLRKHGERQPLHRPPDDLRQPALLGGAHARGRLPVRPRLGPGPRRTRRAAGPTRRSCGPSSPIPVLAGTKIIAEAWDAAGLYQVGVFHRRTLGRNGTASSGTMSGASCKGDRAEVYRLSNRLLGSPDIYPQPERETEPAASISSPATTASP
ncbi:MAG: hypothetical protein M0C28_31585 [Candidatus Moduliflexus flocculans]|nr:hypothetical protein [Candidatus Moduliflexus flocculans]